MRGDVADGAGKDVFDVLMQMSTQISRVEAKVDALVDHEEMAELANKQRREWREDIRSALDERDARMRSDRENAIQAAVSASETRLRETISKSNADQDKRMADREALIEKTAKNVRLQFIGAMTALVATLGAIVARTLFTGGG